jgi:prophage antirepressor-like protein
MEGEFTRLSQIYGNAILFYGTDGDKDLDHRNTRFLKPLHTDQGLKIKFTIADKVDADNDYGMIVVNYEEKTEDDKMVVVSKRNLYRIKKEPPRNQ